jgi:serine/threonine-protein kinase
MRSLSVAAILIMAGAGFAMRASRAGSAKEPLPKFDRVPIPAGAFSRGSVHGADDERPVVVRHLPAFRIDRTEVTRAMYARCVQARRCAPLTDSANEANPDDPNLPNLPNSPNLPVTNVSWTDARAFCVYAGGRLPSEDEWEKAARGNNGQEYPWGNALDCEHANWGNFQNEGPCAGKNPGKPVGVGSYPQGASPYGVLDMAGNVWEWVATKYDRDPSRRVVRGGSCCSYFVEPRVANRNAWDPMYGDGDLGFRCVSQ